jgi:hypothetical protein
MFWLVGSGMISKVETGSGMKPSGSTTGTVRYGTVHVTSTILFLCRCYSLFSFIMKRSVLSVCPHSEWL